MSLGPQPLSISPSVNHGINFGLGLDDLGIKIHLSVAIGGCLFRFSLEGQSSFPMVLSQFSSVQFSRSVVSDSLRPHESQHTRPPCPSSTPGVHSNSCPSSRWCHPAISPLSSPSPSAANSSQHQGLFQWVNSSHEVAKVLAFKLQHRSFQWTPRNDLLQNGLVGSPCSPRDSQESSPTPQFKSINSLTLSFLHSPTLTSIHNHWKTMALTRWIFVGKVISLLCNMLSWSRSGSNS